MSPAPIYCICMHLDSYALRQEDDAVVVVDTPRLKAIRFVREDANAIESYNYLIR